jgi:hypothetical protein
MVWNLTRAQSARKIRTTQPTPYGGVRAGQWYRQPVNASCLNRCFYLPPASYGSRVNSAQTHTAKMFSLNIEQQYVTVSSSYSRAVHNHLQIVTTVGRKWVVTQTFLLYDRGVRRVSSQLTLTAYARVRCWLVLIAGNVGSHSTTSQWHL